LYIHDKSKPRLTSSVVFLYGRLEYSEVMKILIY